LHFAKGMIKYLLLLGISFGFSSPENYRCLTDVQGEYSREMEHLLSALQRNTLEPEAFEKQRQGLYVNLELGQEQCDRQLAIDYIEEDRRVPASVPASIPETQVAE
jgi:hypothetical protein